MVPNDIISRSVCKLKGLAALAAALPLTGCASLVDALGMKSIAPAVVEQAQQEESWYTYLPHRAPGFCLRTRHAIIWKDPHLSLGFWRGLHTREPHRVLMEARGDTLILHRRYVWDGNSFGCTGTKDLLPSLRHDVLYHALKEGAQISRRQIDRAYWRDSRKQGASLAKALPRYLAIRLLGGLFNQSGMKGTLLIEQTTPDTPPAPLEPDRPDDPMDDLGAIPPDP